MTDYWPSFGTKSVIPQTRVFDSQEFLRPLARRRESTRGILGTLVRIPKIAQHAIFLLGGTSGLFLVGASIFWLLAYGLSIRLL